MATAIALGFAYIFTLTFFVSFLYFATVVEKKALASRKKKKNNSQISSLPVSVDSPTELITIDDVQNCRSSTLQKKVSLIIFYNV